MTEALAERARGGENRQQLLDEILSIVLDPVVDDEQVGGLLRSRVAGRARGGGAPTARYAVEPAGVNQFRELDA
ncbi:MAG: hypothetical protein ABR528_09420 [Pseudonocardiaceae bacterium]